VNATPPTLLFGLFLVGAACGDQLGSLLTVAIGGAVVVGLAVFSNDVDRNAANIGVAIVTFAARLIPRAEREACTAEWADHVLAASEDGQGLRPILKGIGIALGAAPILAVLVRYDPQRRRT
jgi:hypothetical protein